jgi:hypothetical protein
MVIHYEAGRSLKQLEVLVGGRPFVVFSGDKPIYSGAFWAGAEWSMDTQKEVLLKFTRRVSDNPERDYLADFEVKEIITFAAARASSICVTPPSS